MAKQEKANDSGMEQYYVRELVLGEDILQKTKQLADMITTTDEVRVYKEAERRVQNHEKIQELIKAIKQKQKEVVAFESFQNEEMVKKIEAEQQELQDELDKIPLVQQFQQTQSDINYMLQMIVNVIRDSLSDHINLNEEHEGPPEHCD